MEALHSTNSMSVDEQGRGHFRMDADTGHLGLTGMPIGEDESVAPSVPPEIADGIYSNLVYLHTLGEEIVLDFAKVSPGVDPVVKARIMLTRENVLALAGTILDKLTEAE